MLEGREIENTAEEHNYLSLITFLKNETRHKISLPTDKIQHERDNDDLSQESG